MADETPKTPDDLVRHWTEELQAAQKETREWREEARGVVKRYLDERAESGKDITKFNILWSNTQVLMPALYARTPQPEVERRYRDKDPLSRDASMALQRALEFTVDAYDFDGTMRQCTQDYLLPGLACARVLYVPEMEEREGEDGKPYEAVAYEKVSCDYVYWEDFLHSPARVWTEVRWVAFREFMSRKALVKRFGEEGKQVPLGGTAKDTERLTPKDEAKKTAPVWEIWSKDDGKVYWMAEGHPTMLDTQDDPLGLSGFFPCPQPLIAGNTTGKLVPKPDYCQYQDQARELDLLTAKITALTDGLKVVGIYAGEHKEDFQHLFQRAKNNELVPVADWALLQGKGGLAGTIEWYPIEQVVNALVALHESREKVKQDLYEVTGIADIVRGASDPDETATAQRIKGRFATLRLEDKQAAVAKFARDLIRLKAELIAEHFSAETLATMTGLDFPMTKAEAMAPVLQAQQQAMATGQPPQEMPTPASSWEEIMALLQDDQLRSFRVDIETDSTIQPDEQEEKQSRIEFMEGVGGFLQNVAPMVQVGVVPADLAKEMLGFVVRGFRVGRELEHALDAMQAPPPQPDPEAEKAKAQVAIEEKKLQAQGQIKAAELAQTATLRREEMGLNLQIEREKMAMDQTRMAEEMALKRESTAMDHELKWGTALVSAQQKDREIEMKGAQGAPGAGGAARTPGAPARVPNFTQLRNDMTALAQTMEQFMAQQQQVMQQLQAQNAALLQAVAAPKHFEIRRGPDGRMTDVVGGSVTVQ
jgi:hypothetical protein